MKKSHFTEAPVAVPYGKRRAGPRWLRSSTISGSRNRSIPAGGFRRPTISGYSRRTCSIRTYLGTHRGLCPSDYSLSLLVTIQ
jgi:hypothetical protein